MEMLEHTESVTLAWLMVPPSALSETIAEPFRRYYLSLQERILDINGDDS